MSINIFARLLGKERDGVIFNVYDVVLLTRYIIIGILSVNATLGINVH